jgi:hypothetical protein
MDQTFKKCVIVDAAKLLKVLPLIKYGCMSEYIVVILIKMLVRQAKTRQDLLLEK